MRGYTRPIRNLLRRDDGFTLIELLITVAIIGILAGMILFAMYRAQETAKAQKTRALVAKLDAIIKRKWESYKTRRVPLPPLIDEPYEDSNGNGVYDAADSFTDTNGNGVRDYYTNTTRAKLRLDALRDMMRMELPDRYTDVVEIIDIAFDEHQVTANKAAPYAPISYPAVFHNYHRRIAAAITAGAEPSLEYEGAEMLYMIVAASLSEDEGGRDTIKGDSVADVDSDGMPEFVDGWGNPIQFIRWPAGFLSELVIEAKGVVTRALTGNPAVIFVDCEREPNPEPENVLLPETPGAFVGGTMAAVEAQGNGYVLDNADKIARITGYTIYVDSMTGKIYSRFICSVPASAGTLQRPFKGDPGEAMKFVVLPRDPFDPLGVYPIYPPGAAEWPAGEPDWSLRTWALYPLIYSAGSDGEYGIVHDVRDKDNPQRVLRYADEGMNPYYIQNKPVPSFRAAGIPQRISGDAINTEWHDNIHNHVMNLR